MSRKQPQRDPAILHIIQTAADAFRSPGADLRRLYRDIDAMPSSTHADIALITWWYLYHYGRAPRYVRPSRGHSYRVTFTAGEGKVQTVDSFDHRRGVVELEAP
jgi:hypothetical protein